MLPVLFSPLLLVRVVKGGDPSSLPRQVLYVPILSIRFPCVCVFFSRSSLLAVYTVRRLRPFICNSLLSNLPGFIQTTLRSYARA